MRGMWRREGNRRWGISQLAKGLAGGLLPLAVPLLVPGGKTARAAQPSLTGQVGVVTRFQEQVTARHYQSTRPLYREAPVYRLDVLGTGPAGRLTVTLNDGSQLTVGENCGASIDDLVYPLKPTEGVITIFSGAFKFEAVPVDARITVIHTPAGRISVRNSIVMGVEQDGAWRFFVQRGRATISARQGSIVKIVQGQTVTIPPNTPPGPAHPWDETRLMRAEGAVRYIGMGLGYDR